MLKHIPLKNWKNSSDMMNRILCILKDMESGITLMKDKDDTKDWTKRDLVRMKKKNLVKGYDVSYGNNLVVFDTSEIQYMYLVDEVVEEEEEEGEVDDDCPEDEEHDKWKESQPHPGWITTDEHGVMFR